MNQQRYIISAVLVLFVAFVIYFGVKKLPRGKDVKSESTELDFEQEVDSLSGIRLEGKRIFQSKCNSCHLIFKSMTGDALSGFMERGPWKDTAILYKYLRTPEKVSNGYIDTLRKMYGPEGIKHLAFPDLTKREIDALLYYIKFEKQGPVVTTVE